MEKNVHEQATMAETRAARVIRGTRRIEALCEVFEETSFFGVINAGPEDAVVVEVAARAAESGKH